MERICRRDGDGKAGKGEDAMKRRCAVEGGGSRRGDDDESARTQR